MRIKAPFLFPRPRRLVEIAPERPLIPAPVERPAAMPVRTVPAAHVAALLDECHRPALRFFEEADGFEFGTHWRWERGERAYTPEGILWLAEQFHNCVSPVAALIIRDALSVMENFVAGDYRA